MPAPAAQFNLPHAPPRRIPQLLAVGWRSVDVWPDPLARWLQENRVHVHKAANLFEVAEHVTREPNRWLAIAVNPDGLTRGEFNMLATIKHHVVLPIWTLPECKSRTHRHDPGFTPWEQAMRTLSQMLLTVDTPQIPEGSSKNTDPSRARTSPSARPHDQGIPHPAAPAHNQPARSPEMRPEIPVASQLAARYDEYLSAPVLTAKEIQALLGPVDP